MIAKKTLIKMTLWGVLVAILMYTRFVGLDWGLPYPMHPDERNMVTAILGMTCHEGLSLDCLNPHFYAYGQVPLIIGYIVSIVSSVLNHSLQLDFNEVVVSLRALSAVSSVATVFVLVKIGALLSNKSTKAMLIAAVFGIFSPVFIQFSHFGTTEAMLMLFVTILLYLAVLFLNNTLSLSGYVIWTGIVFGLAVSTKVSSVFFAAVPIISIMLVGFRKEQQIPIYALFFSLIKIATLGVIIFVVTSPYNLLDWEAFVHSMNYESQIGIGTYKAFYTRQFEYTLPISFQVFKIFPYTLGVPMFILSLFGFLFLPWRKTNILFRLVAIALFIPNAFLYAKWSRFYAPVYPVMILIGSLMIVHLIETNHHVKIKLLRLVYFIGISLLIGVSVLYGATYVAIYKNPDVRFLASQWMYQNIPANTIILSETANVVDVPMPNPYIDMEIVANKNLQPISFDLYEVETNEILERELEENIKAAEYIFVPSRRIFWNHTCFQSVWANLHNAAIEKYSKILSGYDASRCKHIQKEYPLLNAYYQDLFSGQLGFEKVAEFHSYPRIELFGKTLLAFPDEAAEETWTVFDHPVVRIYQKK